MARARKTIAGLVVMVASAAIAGVQPAHSATYADWSYYYNTWNRQAINGDETLLVLANMERSQPSLDGGTEPVAPPLVWNDRLAEAARYHSWDEYTHGCSSHDSCKPKQTFAKRLTAFYPGWSALGENIASGSSFADQTNAAWLASPAHRANILSPNYTEFGGGLVAGSEASYATEDFGSRGGVPIPAIPAATVFVPTEQQNNATWNWQLMLNFYDGQGRAPKLVQASVDGKTYALARVSGTPAWGTWKAVVTTPGWPANGQPPLWCKPVHFTVTRSDGASFRFPATGEIGMGFQPGCDLFGPLPAAPSVTIDSPGSGSLLTRKVVVRAHATDDMKVTTVDVYVDGRRVARHSGSTVTWKWNTTLAEWGHRSHTIVVDAYDAFGIEGSTSMTVRT